MKKTNQCIKCNSEKIVSCKNKIVNLSNGVHINAFKTAIATKYICCDCGYFEEYFDDLSDLESIFNKYR